jgi:prepilin-type N-terminal cleavage/methylation domain-containing protein
MNNIFKKGISIPEVLIVLSVIGVMLLIVLPQFTKLRANQVLKTAVADTLSVLNKARANTLASVNSSEYGVHFQDDKVIIFTGTVYTVGGVGNEETNIVSPASITNVTLNGASGSSGEMYFNRLSGAPSKTGTITIANSYISRVITISATGLASSN